MMVTSHPLHNQTIADDDTFIAHFVARRTTLEALLRRLSFADDDQADLHRVLIGPRGMGKTSLLRRLAIAINRNPDLAKRYVPLTFREEQYNVRRLGDFWRNCGEALAEWAESNQLPLLAERIDDELTGRVWDDENAGDRFATEIQSLGRRAVLLVDNLDLILDGLSQSDGQENWTLRRFLQQPTGPIMIGAATKALGQSAARDSAFYEFFQPDYLNPLDAAETEACMRALAAANGTAGNRVLATLKEQPERLKTLHTLTGGNPRVLALIYRLLETDETGAAMDDLALLLDQVTPYYKARIEEYTLAQRAILDGIALHWDPITIAQLSRVTGTPTTTLSGQITRLVNKDNIVEAVETSKSYFGYQFVERFFNIWYLMRHGTRRTKQKMRWLVEFLTSFYSAAELNDIARRAKVKGVDRHWTPEYSAAISEALSRCTAKKQVANENVSALPEQALNVDPLLRDLIARAAKASDSGDFIAALALYDQVLNQSSASLPKTLLPPLYFNRGITLRHLDRLEEALADYDQIISLLSSSMSDREATLLAWSMLNKSVMLGHIQGPQAERKALDELIDRFNLDSGREETLARALLNRAIINAQEHEISAALNDYDTIITRFTSSTDSEIASRVTQAMFNRAVLFFNEERWSEAIDAFGQIPCRENVKALDSSSEFVAGPAFHQAIAFAELGENEKATAKFDEAINLLQGGRDEEDQQRLAAAVYNKASMLFRIRNLEAAKSVFTSLLNAFEQSENPSIQFIIAHTLIDLARIANIESDQGAEVGYYEVMIAQFAEAEDTQITPLVAQAMVNRALVLDQQTDKTPVIAAYDEVIARFDVKGDLVERDAVLSALVNRAIALGEIDRFDEAFVAFDQIVERFSKDEESSVRSMAAQALYNKAISYFKNGDADNEKATYLAVLKMFGDDPAPEFDELLISSALQLGEDFEQAGDFSEALSVYGQGLARVDKRKDVAPFEALTSLRLNLALLLGDSRVDMDRAEALLREIEVYEPEIGRTNRAWLALLRGDVEGAEALAKMQGNFSEEAKALLTAAIELARGNFGLASQHAEIVLSGTFSQGRFVFTDDYLRLMRIAAETGFGERMLVWLESSGFAERLAPLYVAFRALVRGEPTLRDASPEVAELAISIFKQLTLSGLRVQ